MALVHDSETACCSFDSCATVGHELHASGSLTCVAAVAAPFRDSSNFTHLAQVLPVLQKSNAVLATHTLNTDASTSEHAGVPAIKANHHSDLKFFRGPKKKSGPAKAGGARKLARNNTAT